MINGNRFTLFALALITSDQQPFLPSPLHPERVWSRAIGCFSGGKGSALRADDHRQRGNWLMKASKYACPNPNCRSVFAWKRNLTSHLRYQCGQQPRFKCPYCEYKCKVKTDIRKHIKTKHKNRDVYVIDVFQSWQLFQWERICNESMNIRGEEIHSFQGVSLLFLFSRFEGNVKLSAVEEEGSAGFCFVQIEQPFTKAKTRFPCPNCTSSFGQKASLTRHLKYDKSHDFCALTASTEVKRRPTFTRISEGNTWIRKFTLSTFTARHLTRWTSKWWTNEPTLFTRYRILFLAHFVSRSRRTRPCWNWRKTRNRSALSFVL